MSVIDNGQKGTAVVLLQGILQKMGHRIKSDGIFGPSTEEAVRTFQTEQGIDVDGRVGQDTAKKLVEALYYFKESDDDFASV